MKELQTSTFENTLRAVEFTARLLFISSYLLSLPRLLRDLYKNRNSGKQYVTGSSFRNWCRPPGLELPVRHGRGGDRGVLSTIYALVEGAFLTPLNDSY
jgi:hypothetical protein